LTLGSAEGGILAFGILVGWLLAYTLRRNKINWKQFYMMVTFLGGGWLVATRWIMSSRHHLSDTFGLGWLPAFSLILLSG
jgi:hypothetical protein